MDIFPDIKYFVDAYNRILLLATNYAEKYELDNTEDSNTNLADNKTLNFLLDTIDSGLYSFEEYNIEVSQLIKIAELCDALEKYDFAEKFYQQALENASTEQDKADLTYELGCLYKSDYFNDVLKAKEYFTQSLLYLRGKLRESSYKEPELVNTILELAEENLQDDEVTYNIYKEILEYFPNDLDYKEKYADYVLHHNDSRYWNEAEVIYRELLKDYSYENNSWIRLAQLYEKRGEKKKADEIFKEGLKKSKHFSLLYLEYAEFLVRQNKKNQAIKVYKDLIKENKFENDYYLAIAEEKIELLTSN